MGPDLAWLDMLRARPNASATEFMPPGTVQ